MKKPPVIQVATLQLVILLPISGLLGAVSASWGKSAFLGGLIYIIPGAYFAYYAFRYQGAKLAPQIMRAFFRGEVGKFFLTLVGFGLVFTGAAQLHVPVLFFAYLLMAVVQWYISAKLIAPMQKTP